MDSYALAPESSGGFRLRVDDTDGSSTSLLFETEFEAVLWIMERRRAAEEARRTAALLKDHLHGTPTAEVITIP